MNSAHPRSMLSQHAKDSERLVELTRFVGLRLQEDVGAIIDGMNRAIEEAIDDLDDAQMRSWLHASVANNVEVIVNMMVTKKPAHQIPPVPAAIRYAVLLAQQNVSGTALRRAYHVGSDHLLAHVFEQVEQLECEASEKLQLFHYLAGWTYQYVDEITRSVMHAYEEELRYAHERHARTAAAYISRVLAKQEVDVREFHAATAYRLNQVHIGCMMWIEDISAASDQAELLARAAMQVSSRIHATDKPLITVVDRTSARAWFAMSDTYKQVETSRLSDIADEISGIRMAFGAAEHGVEGFRTSLAQAEHVATVAHVSSAPHSRVVSYADEAMPVIARLAENIAPTRQWVHQVLGSLATDAEHAYRQRETLRVFLESAGSYSQTAEQLVMHRNSIKYRLQRCEEELGRPLSARRLDTQLALALCHALGKTILTPDVS